MNDITTINPENYNLLILYDPEKNFTKSENDFLVKCVK